jgi:peptide/nickel transport system permease protein
MIPVVIGITFVVFSLLQLIPGDPAVSILGIHATPESIAALRHELGLDRPLWEQYLRYMGNLATFDLGQSLKFRVSVTSLLRDRLEVSLALIAYAAVLMVILSLPLGIISALRWDGSSILLLTHFWVEVIPLSLSLFGFLFVQLQQPFVGHEPLGVGHIGATRAVQFEGQDVLLTQCLAGDRVSGAMAITGSVSPPGPGEASGDGEAVTGSRVSGSFGSSAVEPSTVLDAKGRGSAQVEGGKAGC